MLKLNVLLVALLLLVTANLRAASVELTCSFKGNAKAEEPFYGPAFVLAINGDSAKIIPLEKSKKKLKRGSSDSGDEGVLSDDAKRFKRPRFFGFSNFVDCANYGYLEVDPEVLAGKAGEVTLSGQGNEDCGIEESVYTCEP